MVYRRCNECGHDVPEHQLVSTTGKLCYHAEVCTLCYKNLENDEE